MDKRRQADINNRYTAGYTPAQIANELGLSVREVQHVLNGGCAGEQTKEPNLYAAKQQAIKSLRIYQRYDVLAGKKPRTEKEHAYICEAVFGKHCT